MSRYSKGKVRLPKSTVGLKALADELADDWRNRPQEPSSIREKTEEDHAQRALEE